MNLSQLGAKSVSFDGIRVNDYYIVDQIYLENTPETTDYSTKIPGMAGEHYFGSDLNPRHGSMRLSLNTREHRWIDAFDAYHRIWEIFDFTSPKRLDFDGKFHVLAKLQKASAFEQVGIYASTTLEFTCYDPYLYFRDVEIPLKKSDNEFFCTSPLPVWPTIEITGASAPLTVVDKQSGNRILTASSFASTASVVIDMERGRVTANGNYVTLSNAQSDFFMIDPGIVNLNLSSGSGVLRYTERCL